jgi:hypothetical protein
MSALLSHILNVLSQYISIPSSYPFFRTDASMTSSNPSTPYISETNHATQPSKPRAASLVYSTRWMDDTADLDTGVDASRPWSLKGPVVAPQITCPAVPATVLSAGARSEQILRRERECLEGQDPYPDPDTSLNSSFNISLISDTSTSASEDEELPELLLTEDLFTPVLHHHARFESSSYDNDDLLSAYDPHLAVGTIRSRNPALVKCGLGLSGLSRKDGSEGSFDGLGLVGVRGSGRVWRRDVESIEEVDEEEEEQWEVDSNQSLSQAFLREAVYTWLEDPFHSHTLDSIPEGDGEGDLEGELRSESIVESPLNMLLDLDEDPQPEVGDDVVVRAALDDVPAVLDKDVSPVDTLVEPESRSTQQSPRRKVTLTRNLSTATISSGLKRFTSCSGPSTSPFTSPSQAPSSLELNLSLSPSRLSSRRSSSSPSLIRNLPTSSSNRSLPSNQRSLTPVPGIRPGTRSTTPVSNSGMIRPSSGSGLNKSRPATPTNGSGVHPGVRRSQSLGSQGANLLGERGWRV